MGLLRTLFDWPNGIVVGNLIASAICVVLATIHLDRLAKKHHKIHITHLKGIHNLMPYEVKGPNSDGKYEVVNKDTGDVKATKTTKEDAERQVRLLHAVEHGWEPTNNG